MTTNEVFTHQRPSLPGNAPFSGWRETLPDEIIHGGNLAEDLGSDIG
jgi:hypothetical protein